MSLRSALSRLKHKVTMSTVNLDVPGARRRAWWYMMFFDHGVLRTFWSNFDRVSKGLYRSNHPTQKRFDALKTLGFNTIINLRGISHAPHYQLEVETCKALGLTLVDIENLSARSAPRRADLLLLLEALRTARRPVLMHCKSGADRTSLAAAIFLLAEDNATVAEARKQLSWKYVHLKWTKTGVLDHILDLFEDARSQTGIGFEDWLRTVYDADTVQRSFEATRS